MMKKMTFYLVLVLSLITTLTTYSQCIPASVRTVSGTVTGSTGVQTFTAMPNGNVVRITAPAIGTFYTISMCATNATPQADGVNDSHITLLSANSAAATSLGFNDDFCATTGASGYGPSEMTYTATAVGDFFVYLTEWGADACNDDGLNTSYIMTVTKTAAAPPCDAGVLTTVGSPFTVCPADSFTVATNGTESTPNDYAILFTPLAGATGGTGAAINLTAITSFPFTANSDLNGVLSGQPTPLPALSGNWSMKTRAVDASGVYCSTSVDSIIVNFVLATDPSCGPPSACDAGVLSTVGFPVSICITDSFTLSTDGSEVTPNDFAMYLSPQATGSGGLGIAFSLTGVTFPLTENSDLSGVLSSNGYPVLEGEWAIYTASRDAADIVCSLSADSILVTFLDSNDITCLPPTGTPCDTSATGPFVDLNNAGGAPCDDGTGCTPTAVTFGAWASESYLLDNVQSGFDYVFDICSGNGAGAWIPALTIIAPSGAVDAFNLGATGTFAMNCSLAWTATESGTYTIFIHEAGMGCLAGNAIDNGTPTVTCGLNPATCSPTVPCVAGVLTSPSVMTICSNEIDSIVLDGTESTPGSYSVGFDDSSGGTGGLAGGFIITTINQFPWTFDDDLEGVLSSQVPPLAPLSGVWTLTVYNDDGTGLLCDSIATTISVNFVDSTNVLCTGTVSCNISAISGGTQTACNSVTNTYSQNVVVTYSNAPATGTLDVNGQSFAITTSPQVVTLTNLVSNGNAVDVTTSFSANAACDMTLTNVFTAPVSCACSITDVTIGLQSPCVNATNFYTQAVTVFYVNPPTSGMLNVNGQNVAITSSPQTVILTGLSSDGLAVDIAAAFTANASCVYSASAAFMAPTGCLCPAINVNVTTTNVTNCSSPDGTATAMASGGTGSYTYAWTPSSFGSGITISNIPSGTYAVIATDGNGCSGTGSSVVNNTSGVNALVGVVNNVSCNGASDGEINISASGGVMPISYTWSDQGFASTVSSRTNLAAGFYTITVADNGGCSVVLGPIEITQPDQLIAIVDNSSDISCNGANDGSINVTVTGGNGNNSYVWTNGGGNNEDASGLDNGSYALTVTDAGCPSVTTSTVMITEPDAININIDNQNDVTCFGDNNGNILVTTTGGNGALSFDWDNAPDIEDAQNLSGGTYQLTVTDAAGCPSVSSAVININEPSEIVVSIDAFTDVTCFDANDGTITASVVGGVGAINISWTNSTSTSLAPTSLAASSYQLTVTDANMCAATSLIVTISDAIMLTATSTTTDETASGNDGTATVVTSGGTPNYSYVWTPSGQTTAAASELSAGSYTCDIEDDNGCTHKVTVIVSRATAIGEIALNELVIYPNPSNGTFTVSFETPESLDFEISMINTIGKEVYNNSFVNVNGIFTEQIAVKDLANGIYFLEISNRDAKTVNKITISK
jgi:hypothetical protein